LKAFEIPTKGKHYPAKGRAGQQLTKKTVNKQYKVECTNGRPTNLPTFRPRSDVYNNKTTTQEEIRRKAATRNEQYKTQLHNHNATTGVPHIMTGIAK
ncbi:unnamed protein product, partial [Ceratitis capitata]